MSSEPSADAITRAVALELNDAINMSAKRHGAGVTGATVVEALLLCILGRMKHAADLRTTPEPWSKRRALVIAMFDNLAEAMGVAD